MNKRILEFHILVTLKTFHGIFKPTLKREEFKFCSDSRDFAIRAACNNLKPQGFPFDEAFVQVLGAVPVDPFPESQPLRSLSEVQSEREEDEWIVSEETKAVLEKVA
jgi:hypothetical protein